MASQSATLLEAKATADGWEVRARLRCGCEVTVAVPKDRVVETMTGRQILVGKYPCPLDHPV